MEELTTLNLTIDELDELIAAESHMYMDYDDERSEQYNESIRKYNDKVDALLNKLKAAYKEAKENKWPRILKTKMPALQLKIG